MDFASWIVVGLLGWLGVGLVVAWLFGRVAQAMESPEQRQDPRRGTYIARKVQQLSERFGH
ncbi:MAG: hypothetical protein ABIS68_02140 [Casimicrobiaceae bacterium]